MGKKKRIATLTMCLVMSCASIGLVSACGGGDNPQPDPGPSPVVTVERSVTFNSLDGSAVPTQKVKDGEKATEPTPPTRAGYVFVEWLLNGKKYDFNSAVTGDIILTAKWKEVQFTVTFKNENETFKTEKVNQGRKVAKPATDPTREGYVFDYWALNNAEYDFNTAVTADITLTAKWIKAYQVTFNVGEGTAVDPVWIKTGETVTAPTTTRTGYKVTDWLLNGVSYDFSTPITADITLTAVWSAQGLASNQFGVIANAWDQKTAEYINVTEGINGEIAIAAKFVANEWRWPAVVLRNLYSQDYYETLIADGNNGLKFNLAISGADADKVTDLYVFGQKLSTFPENSGVYAITINLQYIVDNYATIGVLGMSTEAVPSAYFNQMLFAWRCKDGTDYTTNRNYVFTISDMSLITIPQISVDFAAGNKDVIKLDETTKLVATTNMDPSAVTWSSSDTSIATVVGGEVTPHNVGTVDITATVGGVSASKKVTVIVGNVLYSNQFGVIANAWDQKTAEYINVTAGASGEIVVAAKFAANEWRWPAVVLRNLASQDYYEDLIADGNNGLKFNLAISGADADKVSDLYVFGKKLSTFPVNAGVYTITIELQYIVDNYATIGTLGMTSEAVPSQYFNQMLLAWRCKDGTDYTTNRNYVFTISNIEAVELATVAVEFAPGSKEMIDVGATTTLTATTNKDSSLIVWSSSDPSVATVANGVVTGVKGGEVEITATVLGVSASKKVYVIGDGLYSNQIGINAYGWNQTGSSTYFNMEVGGSGEMVVTAKFSGDTTYYPTLALRNLYSKAYYEKLIKNGYAKLTFSVKVGGTNASSVSDLYAFGTKLTDYGRSANDTFIVVVDLQHIVDNYDTIGGLGTAVKASGTTYLNQMLLAWKSTEWTERNYVFTFSKPMFVKGLLFTNNIGLRANGNNMLGNTSYLSVDNGDNGELVINAKFQANPTYYPNVTLRNLPEKAYFQQLIDDGYTTFTFNLKVSGADADKLDLHILATGKTINQFTQEANGGYRIEISLANIVQFYDTIVQLGTGSGQVGTTGSKSSMFISWRSPADDYTSVRNYTFTISDTGFSGDLVW